MISWGYTSLFNLLDYPSTILPIHNFKVNPDTDPVNPAYRPLETNPYDKLNYELCKSTNPPRGEGVCKFGD